MKHLRSVLGSVCVGAGAAFSVATAGAVVAPTSAPVPVPVANTAAPVVEAGAPAAAPAAAVSAPTVSTTRPRHARPTTASRTTTVSTTTARPARAHRRSETSGCGQRAVSSGIFNPSCSEYQGYLDPGRSAGRAPSSGDIQSEWADCTATRPDAECRTQLN